MIFFKPEFYQDPKSLKFCLIYNIGTDENPTLTLYNAYPEVDEYQYMIQQVHAEIIGLV